MGLSKAHSHKQGNIFRNRRRCRSRAGRLLLLITLKPRNTMGASPTPSAPLQQMGNALRDAQSTQNRPRNSLLRGSTPGDRARRLGLFDNRWGARFGGRLAPWRPRLSNPRGAGVCFQESPAVIGLMELHCWMSVTGPFYVLSHDEGRVLVAAFVIFISSRRKPGNTRRGRE